MLWKQLWKKLNTVYQKMNKNMVLHIKHRIILMFKVLIPVLAWDIILCFLTLGAWDLSSDSKRITAKFKFSLDWTLHLKSRQYVSFNLKKGGILVRTLYKLTSTHVFALAQVIIVFCFVFFFGIFYSFFLIFFCSRSFIWGELQI